MKQSLRSIRSMQLPKGTDAQAEVSVRLEDTQSGRSVTGRAADPDTLVASAKAYIAGLNKIEMRSRQTHPQHGAA